MTQVVRGPDPRAHAPSAVIPAGTPDLHPAILAAKIMAATGRVPLGTAS